jgi:hydrogenase maturation protease
VSTDPSILILCIGNPLMQDDGFGPRVAESLLAGYDFSEEVAVYDRGVMGMAMLADLRGIESLLVIDASDNTGHPPGTVLRFAPGDLADDLAFHGAHDIRLVDVLGAAALLGLRPEVSCLGVQVAEMSQGAFAIGLSPAVEAAVPKVVGLALAWLSDLGVAARPKT